MAVTAKDIMSKTVLSVRPETSVPAIAKLLIDNEISAVPVVDEAGKLVGIVSEGDLMKPFSAKYRAKREWWLELLAEGERLAPEFIEYIKLEHHKAADVMTKPVITVTEETDVGAISDLMIEHRIKRVPVLRGDKIVGIVSRADIVRILANADR